MTIRTTLCLLLCCVALPLPAQQPAPEALAKALISSGVSGLAISGAVILKKLVSGLAPAIALASYRSLGIALMRPEHRIMM